MMAASGGRFLTSLFSFHKLNVGLNIYCGSILQSRNYALRKGTREKKKKQKARNIALKKVAPPDHYLLRKKKLKRGEQPDALKFREPKEPRISPDDVWVSKYYDWKIFSFEEAVQSHRDVFHPTIYNIPNANIKAKFELNMQGPKKNKLISAFNGLVSIPNKFTLEDYRSILVFAKTPEQQQEARDAGATLVAGPELIRLIRIGEMSIADFHAVIAHPSILAELLCVKGIMKNKFPTLKLGTLGPDLKSIIYKHLYGVKYTGSPDVNYPQYGVSEITFGTLNMDTNQLEENFKAVVNAVESHKPRRPGPFITRIRLKCPPNKELFKIDHRLYVKEEEPVVEEEDEDEQDTVARAEI